MLETQYRVFFEGRRLLNSELRLACAWQWTRKEAGHYVKYVYK